MTRAADRKAEASGASAAQCGACDSSAGKDSGETPTQAVRVGRLDTLEDLRREMGRLYRAARRTAGAEPDAAVASKLAYLLSQIGRNIEGAALEQRVIELERRLTK